LSPDQMLPYVGMAGPGRKLPPLAALRVFEAAGRHGNFAGAAAELGITPSAVSHGVRALEDSLGISLFRRDRRGPALTPAGDELLKEATRAFEGLADVLERISGGREGVGLRVSVAPTFAARWLLPRLSRLRTRHPSLAVSITTEREWVEVGDGRFDLAIRMAREPVGAGEWHRLATVRLVPVASPALAAGTAPRLLERLPTIHVTTTREDWATWAAATGTPAPEVARGLRFDVVHMAIDAAAQGLGVALARLPVCHADISARRVMPLAAPIETETSYWLVARPGALRQLHGRLFAAWLHDELAQEQRELEERQNAPRPSDGLARSQNAPKVTEADSTRGPS
jgi:LysR family transcriptional regulator, glycine cleavage system transcriptional activator